MEKEIELSNGTLVKVEPVPWALLFDAMASIDELRISDPPLDTVKVKGGGVEYPPMLPGNPKYDEWKVGADKIEAERDRFLQHAVWEAGVKAWKPKGAKRWETQPPKDYTVPSLMVKMGGFSPYLDNERIAYIRYVVCGGMADITIVQRELMQGMPLTQQEVDAAVDGFQDQVQGTDD